jgi:hypothetical protein
LPVNRKLFRFWGRAAIGEVFLKHARKYVRVGLGSSHPWLETVSERPPRYPLSYQLPALLEKIAMINNGNPFVLPFCSCLELE